MKRILLASVCTVALAGGLSEAHADTCDVTGAAPPEAGAVSTGANSFACGPNASTDDAVRATAVGVGATAEGDRSTAVGNQADTGEFVNATAVGRGATVTGNQGTAVGNGATAATQAAAVGDGVSAEGSRSVAVGFGASTTAGSGGAVAIGNNAAASNSSAVAIGNNAQASGTFSYAGGREANAGGERAVSIGFESAAGGNRSIAVGEQATANGNFSIAIGDDAQANNNNSVAIGVGAVTTEDNQIMLGTSTETVAVPGDLDVDGLANFNGGVITNNDLTVNLDADEDFTINGLRDAGAGSGNRILTIDDNNQVEELTLDDLEADLGLPQIRNRLDSLEDDVDELQGGVAAAFALGAIQQNPTADGLQLSMAYGNWEGESGVATMAGGKVADGVYVGAAAAWGTGGGVGGAVTGTIQLNALQGLSE